MTKLHAALVTPMSGPLARFGRESAKALSLWAEPDEEPDAAGVRRVVWPPNRAERSLRYPLPGSWAAKGHRE